VTGSGNHVGSVFNLTPDVKGSQNFRLIFEAANQTPFSPAVLDRVEVMITRGHEAQPSLPNIPLLLALLLGALLTSLVFSRSVSRREKVVRVVFLLIILLAAYLRWNEVVRVSGTHIAGDAKGYLQYAQKMELFSDDGFYSAQFEKREPLYIFIVKLFFLLFGVSGTHLRFVSFVFSLVTVYLTYKIGKEWINESVGLIAACILAVHPYLIQLSARGLRAEWFTTLVLLFVFYGYVKGPMGTRLRTLITGLLIGCMLLTRSEALFMVLILMMAYPVVARSTWNYKMVFTALLLGITLWIPHQYGMYKNYGDPFYTVNQYARFYANREFAGQPGFPTREELATKGMYTGRKITPLEYYCSLHSPWQLVQYSVVGFMKIHLTMPFHYAAGKGTLSRVEYLFGELRKKMNGKQLRESSRQLMAILQKNFLSYTLTAVLVFSFLVGIVLLALSPYRMLLLVMLFVQVQTSFVAYLGIDSRLTVHSYPLIALCCGYCLWWMSSGLRRRFEGTYGKE
jgi:4-amino-4-deoxy-L-arabinose transferase-like glycosyltransferase